MDEKLRKKILKNPEQYPADRLEQAANAEGTSDERREELFEQYQNTQTTRADVQQILQVYHNQYVMPVIEWAAYKQKPIWERAWIKTTGVLAWCRDGVTSLYYRIPAPYRVSGNRLEAIWGFLTRQQFGWRPLREGITGLLRSEEPEVPCESCGEREATTEHPVGPDNEYLCGQCLQETVT